MVCQEKSASRRNPSVTGDKSLKKERIDRKASVPMVRAPVHSAALFIDIVISSFL